MGSDGRLICYSTMHLSRREEILIQSIISLYNSKDNHKWIYRETGDDISAMVVGSEAKVLIGSGNDPFTVVDEKHIIIMLGDLFYPKNARALVRVGLPIKALDLVDKLGYIERNIINKPVSVGYIAANLAVAMKEVQTSMEKQNTAALSHEATIKSPDIKPLIDAKIIHPTSEQANHPLENLAATETAEEVMSVSSISQELQKPAIAAEQVTLSPTHVKEEQEIEEVIDVKLDSFPSFKFVFPNDTPVTESEEVVAMTGHDLVSPESIVAKDTFDYTPPKIAATVSQTNVASEIKPAINPKDTIDYVPPRGTIPSISNNIDAPTLTEVAPRHVARSATVVPLYANNPRANPAAHPSVEAVSSQTTVSSIGSTPAVVSSVVSSALVDEQPQVIPEDGVTSKRIKLLRWPKSEVIQRHPGNAILASMVINVPMSVEDMAKQSDLPLQICQKFIDAVVETHVGIYVDFPESAVQAPVVTQTVQAENSVEPEVEIEQQEEKKEKRKGILYRIRAALGLLRK